jgi:hypothetical protein
MTSRWLDDSNSLITTIRKETEKGPGVLIINFDTSEWNIMARIRTEKERDMSKRIWLDNTNRHEDRGRGSGHMDFGEWSGKLITTRATAHLGGHPVSDFIRHHLLRHFLGSNCYYFRTPVWKRLATVMALSPFSPPIIQFRPYGARF